MKKITSLFISLILLAGVSLAQEKSASELPALKDAKAMINGLYGGEITINDLNNGVITIDKPGYKVTSFTVTLTVGDDLCSITNNGNTLNKRQTTLVDKQTAGKKVYIEDIICSNEAGEFYTVSPITLIIKN